MNLLHFPMWSIKFLNSSFMRGRVAPSIGTPPLRVGGWVPYGKRQLPPTSKGWVGPPKQKATPHPQREDQSSRFAGTLPADAAAQAAGLPEACAAGDLWLVAVKGAKSISLD
jgi:hypothetical protein